MPKAKNHLPRWFIFYLAALSLNFPAPADEAKPPHLAFSVGAGQTRLPASGHTLALHHGRMELGTPVSRGLPVYLALTAETFRVYRMTSKGNDHFLRKTHYHGRGLGLKSGAYAGRWEFWLAAGGGVIRADYFADSETEEEKRYHFQGTGGGLSFAVYQSDLAAISFMYEAERIQPRQSWQEDYGFASFLMHHISLGMKLASGL